MSRLIKYPINVPNNVEIKQNGQNITIKGPKGEHQWNMSKSVDIDLKDNELYVRRNKRLDPKGNISGTERAVIKNMINGVVNGYSKKLILEGVGYRAVLKDNQVEINVGFSHLVHYTVPEDITIETPTQTEIVISGINKQRVGQIAAEIRSIRPPEPYKGKGIRYDNEVIIQKEGKKK